MKDKVEELKRVILALASRDVFNGKGRVFIEELVSMGYRYEDVCEAIRLLSKSRELRTVGNIIIVKL